MLKLLWLLLFLVIVYVSVVLINKKQLDKQIMDFKGEIRIIQPETRVSSDVRITIIDVGGKQMCVINSSSGMCVEPVEIEIEKRQKEWEEQIEGLEKELKNKTLLEKVRVFFNRGFKK